MAAMIGLATSGVLILGIFYACYKTGRGGVEHAKYALVRSFKSSPHLPFEVRRYASAVAAKTFIPFSSHSENNMRSTTSTGFRRVAGYIFGANSASQSRAMTAPVISRKIPSENGVELSFILPSAIQSTNDTPQPNSAQVTLEEIPQHFASVYAYYGDYPSTEKMEEIGRKLLMAMKIEKIQPISFSSGVILDSNEPPVNLRVMSYDPPWIPTFLKLNEISIICGISQMSLSNE